MKDAKDESLRCRAIGEASQIVVPRSIAGTRDKVESRVL